MNIWSGGNQGTDGGWGPSWLVYRKMGDMLKPGPANTITLLEEREDSINDGMFVVDMMTYPNSTASIVDFPASYHGGSGGFSFADGHSELKKWHNPLILERPLVGQSRPYPTPLGGNDKDVQWMQERSTRVVP